MTPAAHGSLLPPPLLVGGDDRRRSRVGSPFSDPSPLCWDGHFWCYNLRDLTAAIWLMFLILAYYRKEGRAAGPRLRVGLAHMALIGMQGAAGFPSGLTAW